MTFYIYWCIILLERGKSLKKYLIKYYGLIYLCCFIINNVILINLTLKGILYILLLFLLALLNVFIIWKYNKEMKFKGFFLIVSIILFLFSKNLYYAIFDIINILSIIIFSISYSRTVRVITIISAFLFLINYFWVILVMMIVFSKDGSMNDIYDDTHYYCENNYEVYSYSAGAMDSFHYSIGKYYEILNIDGIISITYNERNEKTYEEYNTFIKNHNCSLVGDKNGKS